MTDAGFLDVQSTDGTPIRVCIRGDGPPIALVHGSLRDHTIFEPLIARLQPGMTTYAIDRRGFGGSGDRDPYTIEQEFRDVAGWSMRSLLGRARSCSGDTRTVLAARWALRR